MIYQVGTRLRQDRPDGLGLVQPFIHIDPLIPARGPDTAGVQVGFVAEFPVGEVVVAEGLAGEGDGGEEAVDTLRVRFGEIEAVDELDAAAGPGVVGVEEGGADGEDGRVVSGAGGVGAVGGGGEVGVVDGVVSVESWG